jgi:hypothetical protein
MPPDSVAPAADAELAEVLIAALNRGDEPLALTKLGEQVPTPFKKAKNRFESILNELVAQGRLHQFSAFGRTKGPRFWTRDANHFARELIVRMVAQKGPTRPNDLWKPLSLRLKDWSKEQFGSLLLSLIQERRIRELPPLPGSKVKRLSVHPPSAREYLGKVFEKSVAKPLRKIIGLLREAGVSPAELREDANAIWRETLASLARLPHTERTTDKQSRIMPSLPEVNIAQALAEEFVLQGMTSLKPNAAQGAMVALPDLRKHLHDALPTKEAFDAAVLRLAEAGRVDLHFHSFPASLAEPEKAALVTDGKGNFYMGIVLRS